MTIRVIHRPAKVVDGLEALDREFRSARWAHHQLLRIEDDQAEQLDLVADMCAPGLRRVGRILAKLRRRACRAERATGWSPNPRVELRKTMAARMRSLKAQRDADPRWKIARGWLDASADDAPVKACRRKAGESDALYDARVARRKRRSRREEKRLELYSQIRCHYDTWNELVKQVDQAIRSVRAVRKTGQSARWKHPRYDDPTTIASDHWDLVERGPVWWVIDLKLRAGVRVRLRTKAGTYDGVPADPDFRTLKLTRRRVGRFGWEYSCSIAVNLAERVPSGTGVVALDWGHREHGHATADQGIRVFTWAGDDGQTGEVLLPIACRDLLSELDELKGRLDTVYAARGEPELNRARYRRRLNMCGVLTREEQDWLRWETRQDRRLSAMRDRIEHIRRESYLKAIHELGRRYRVFAFEDLQGQQIKDLQTENQMGRRKRQNRDLSARYLFESLCKQSGAERITVPARNSTRQCPACGKLREKTADLLVACDACGYVGDRDRDACRTLLARAKEALAKRGASVQND
ncbi:MAG: hypothetical protein A2Y78_00095 [Acidobacteria bacterium RBG_13_68_16]|nr:MAG: hypothetical protein A2Y78_00095 [Acidobacteria bacterium RBG_13_68_16]